MESIVKETFLTSLSDCSSAREIPDNVLFELTYGCNYRCVHCLNPTHRALPQELTREEIFKILEETAELGVLAMTFTGGEMFVRPDIFEILRKAKSLGFLIDLLTNASLITEAHAQALEQIGLEDIGVSIYGATQETYENVTAVPGSYPRFLAGLRALAKTKLHVKVRLPLMTLNSHELEACKALVESFGFNFQPCLEIQPRQDGSLDPLQYRLSPAEKVRLTELSWDLRTAEPISTDTCKLDGEFLDCACGKKKFAVSPYGEMNLCVAFPAPKYDLRKGSVRQGWEVLKNFARSLKPNQNYECPPCHLQKYCRQGRNDAWLETGDPSVCLPHFYDWASLEKKAYENANSARAVR